ncbi:hypothetical protein FBU30_011224 [Linnemannia zychae]|nr:hypothetical protein FBU30_011224 [Linnemannia zychae]
MVNLQGFEPYHLDADESKKMECDHHSGSPILNTQEVAFAEEHRVYPEKVEFITTSPLDEVPNCILWSYQLGKTFLCKEWTTHDLAKVVPPKPALPIA